MTVTRPASETNCYSAADEEQELTTPSVHLLSSVLALVPPVCLRLSYPTYLPPLPQVDIPTYLPGYMYIDLPTLGTIGKVLPYHHPPSELSSRRPGDQVVKTFSTRTALPANLVSLTELAAASNRAR